MSALFSSFNRDVSIDIGTMYTRATTAQGRALIVEPSMVATDSKQEAIVAVGEEAQRIVRLAPDEWRPLTPLKDGFIIDYRVTHTMLHYFMHKATKSVRRSRVFLSTPCGMTDVEERAMMDAVIQAGAREVYLMETPVLATLGSGLPVFDAQGSMAVDIGSGTVDIGIVSLGGVVTSRSIRVGGDDLNAAILQYINQAFSMIVADQTVETIKRELGSAIPTSGLAPFTFKGRDMTNGLMKQAVIHPEEVAQVLQAPIQRIITELRNVIRKTEPELVGDILRHGMVLTGGSAYLSGLDQCLAEALHIPVRIPAEPEYAVVRGLQVASKNIVMMDRFIYASKRRKGKA